MHRDVGDVARVTQTYQAWSQGAFFIAILMRFFGPEVHLLKGQSGRFLILVIFIQSCAEKRDCFAKHQPGVADYGWLQPGRNFLST